MATSTLIRLENPKIDFTDREVTPVTTSLECMANQLNFGATIEDAANSFCAPNGLGEAFVEIAIGTSIDWLQFVIDNTNSFVDAVITFDSTVASPAAENWVWAGPLWVGTLTTVLNAEVRGYTRETVRFESRGQSWTYDAGAGPLPIPGWA